jgi:hypothetical protein
MARPKAATPAAHIRGIVRFFETASLELADVAFELARAALAERKARKKPGPAATAKPAKPPEQKVMVGTNYPAANAPGGQLTQTPETAVGDPKQPTPAVEARPANKKRLTGAKKKKPTAAAAGAGKKRGPARPTGTSTVIPETEALPEQHATEELNEGPPTPMW